MADTPEFQSFSRQFQWAASDKVLANLRSLMALLDLIVLPLRDSKADYDEAVVRFTSILQERFAQDIQPIFDQITSDASLGALFVAGSEDRVTARVGVVSFTLGVGDRLRFAPAAYLAAICVDDPSIAMLGALSDFDRGTGQLAIQVTSVSTPGATRDRWRIVATPPPFVPVGFNAGSMDDGPPTNGTPYVSLPNGASGGISGGTY